MNVAVIVSSISLALDDPFEEPDAWKKKALFFADIFFAVLFGIEAFIKIVAQGFVVTSLRGKGRKAYLCDIWNVLDFLVEIVSILDVCTTILLPQDENTAEFAS